MTEHEENESEYSDDLIARLGLLWGDGFLSPGGATEVAIVLEGLDSDRISFQRVQPGPFPFPDQTFDIVFSKDSMIHESSLIRGSLKSKALELLGAEAYEHWLEVRSKEDIFLDKGELRPTHLRARRPG